MNVSLPLSERVLVVCCIVAFWWTLAVLAKRKLPERPFLLVFRALFFALMLGYTVCFVLDRERLANLLAINAWGSWWVNLVLQKKFGQLEAARPISLNLSGREPIGNRLN